MAVEAIGFVGGGGQRWLDLGFMQLRPSELSRQDSCSSLRFTLTYPSA